MFDCDAFDQALAETPDLGRLGRAARAHAAGCASCRRLLADLEAIVTRAANLPTPEPPAEIWEQIRRQLEKEGLIRSDGAAPRRAPTPRARTKKTKAGALPRLVHSAPRNS